MLFVVVLDHLGQFEKDSHEAFGGNRISPFFALVIRLRGWHGGFDYC